MNTLKALFKKIRVFTKKYGFFVTILGLLFLCVRVYYWQPPANVSLTFDGSLLGWMRPDFGLPNDLKMLGFKETSKKTIGMAYYDMLLGWLRNTGHKDTDQVEMKVPVDGTLSIQRVSGWPDNPNLVSKSEAVVIPDQYVHLGQLRVDDPPFLLVLYCSTGKLDRITFRYRENDATRTTTYVVRKDPSTDQVRIVPQVFWGMDTIGIKRFAWNCGIGVILFGLLAYWQRRRIFGVRNFLWRLFVIAFNYCRNHVGNSSEPPGPAAAPVVAAPPPLAVQPVAAQPPSNQVPQQARRGQKKKKKKNRNRK